MSIHKLVNMLVHFFFFNMQFLVELLHKKKELAVTPDMKLNVFRQVLILVHSDDKKLIVAMFLH